MATAKFLVEKAKKFKRVLAEGGEVHVNSTKGTLALKALEGNVHVCTHRGPSEATPQHAFSEAVFVDSGRRFHETVTMDGSGTTKEVVVPADKWDQQPTVHDMVASIVPDGMAVAQVRVEMLTKAQAQERQGKCQRALKRRQERNLF